MEITKATLDHIFTYHAPKGSQTARYEKIREAAKAYAFAILDSCPDSRERTRALESIKTSTMEANASIAINE